ncbi:nuclear transport factor 2 family protein [Ruegeria hyattellae]|uniref:nuclear transport factor 2 family protein n=1 Tax=Ruegeria hyattellae TaxID=3233337 RepID=UPI00355C6464
MLFEAALEKAARYAAAWSSNEPEQVAGHFAQNGSAVLNAGAPIQGRADIAENYAAPFFRDFPNSNVLVHDFRLSGNHGLFTGMLVAPPYLGMPPVRLLGWEEWTLDDNGLIRASLVWFDHDEHARQVR